MKAYWGVEVQLYSCLTLTPAGVQCSASRSGRLSFRDGAADTY